MSLSLNLFKDFPVGVCGIDQDYTVKLWNMRLEHWTGVEQDEILEKDLRDFFPNLREEKYAERLKILFEQGTATVFSSLLHGSIFECETLNPLHSIHNVTAIPAHEADEFDFLFIVEDVTALRKRSKDFEDQSRQFRLIMENIPDAVFLKDDQFKIVQANRAFLNFFPDNKRDRVIGSTMLEEFKEEEAEVFLEQDKKALKEGYAETEETATTSDGTVRNLLSKKARFENAQGEKFVLAIVHDITQQKKTELKLKESEERYEVSVRGSSVGLWDWNPATGELFWSDRFKDIVGISDEDFRPKIEEFFERLHPEDSERIMTALNDHIEKQTPYDVEYRLRRQDGSYVWIHARGQAIWDDDGKPLRVAGSVDDISAKKQAEEQLKERTNMLQLAEITAKLGHWRYDVLKQDIFWSDQVYEIHGVSPDKFQPNIDNAIEFYHPDDRDEVKTALQLAIEEGKDFRFQLRIVRKDGQAVDVESRGKPEFDKDGNVTSIFGVFQDITERKKAEEELLQINEELDEFAYRTSHDLRSPLVSSIGLMKLVQDSFASKQYDDALVSLNHIDRSLKKLEVLVGDILDLTEARNKVEEIQIVNIEKTIEEAEEKFSHLDNFESITIEKEFEETKPLRTQKSRLQLIAENLLSNAIKYADLEKNKPYVRIKTYEEGESFILEIQDNGLGIPKDKQENMFKMFKRFHPKTSFGSGLGLYMMKKSADMMGAEISFEDPGEGVIFKLIIPFR